ncbi:HAD-IIB family hydrolase [Alteribacillus bidgolensis]|uniref:Kanosamine-6-phosphate phosphatase n=1 Tax=Alteribacillus bidgolensis TaxID=930129 RepID=A0A1G8NIR2_9BACI|nr:HAD-IIB family hydrolase [Alteribacillus bidgolensis]SDI80055.1 kanosamine-6-phosphate phosphatase [Alteribacillus bidgolensis]
MNFKLNKSFLNANEAKYIIFFDFDETYFPHDCTDELLKNLNELEEYLHLLVQKQFLKIGWVTGSDLNQIAHKMERANISYSPHFIASNLGTEVYNVSEKGDLLPNKEWENRLKKVNFSSDTVKELESELYNVYNIELVEQTQLGQKGYKWNYYYFEKSKTKSQYDLKIISHVAKLNGLGININRCNPKAGDPKGAFDVDFIPLNTGKKEIVKFMIKYYQVPLANTIAFGDSGNDVEMLKTVQYGYLLGNATEEAKGLHDNVTISHYSLGILEVLKKLFPNP